MTSDSPSSSSKKPKTPAAWKPDDLAGALDYQRPNYGNLFATPGSHTMDETRAVMAARAKTADDANKTAYDTWQSKYGVAKAQRDATDAAAADAYAKKVNDFNSSLSAVNHREQDSSNYAFLSGGENSTYIGPAFTDQNGVAHQGMTPGGSGGETTWTPYTPAAYSGPTYTDWSIDKPTDFSGILQSQAAQTANAAKATFGGRVTSPPSGSFLQTFPTSPQVQPQTQPQTPTQPRPNPQTQPGSNPQTQPLTPARITGPMPQQPQYIGAGMGTPNTAQNMGRGLSAAAVRAPGK